MLVFAPAVWWAVLGTEFGSAQSRTVLSELPERARRPSADIVTLATYSVCPSKCFSSCPVSESVPKGGSRT